jgi:transposase
MKPLDQTAIQATVKQANLTCSRDPIWGLVLVLLALLGWLMGENSRQRAEMADVKAALQLERAKRFGRSSERSAKDNPAPEENLSPLVIEGEAHEIGGTPTPLAPHPEPRQRGGQPGHKGHGRSLPPNLPRQEVECGLPVEAQCCSTCGRPYASSTLTEDSEEVVIEVKAHVRRYRRKRYRSDCDCPGPKLITAPIPPKVIPKGKFSVESWVKFLLDKYQFQIPIARQVKQLAQIGLPVAESTIHGGFHKLSDYLLPLYEAFLVHLRTAQHLHADETSWRLFEEVPGKANHRWWLWVFASKQVGLVVFVLDPSRSAKVPKMTLSEQLPAGQSAAEGRQLYQIDDQTYVLNDNLAVISADRLRVYQAISDLIRVAFCWSHQRRDFVDFSKSYANQPLLVAWAESWVEEIGQLYALNDARLTVRNQPELFQQAQAKLEAAVAAMKNRTTAHQGLLLAQEKILVSMERHWTGLILFVADPDIPMDNNWAERLIRLGVMGRNNYYGHHAIWAGELAAMVFSIIETCQLNGLNPYQFLLDYFNVCAQLGQAPSDLTPFLPWLNKSRSPP